MNNIEVTANNITTAPANMSNRIFRTTDKIPVYFLCELLLGLLMYYVIRINLQYLSTAKIPRQWKQALGIPLQKKGNSRNALKLSPYFVNKCHM